MLEGFEDLCLIDTEDAEDQITNKKTRNENAYIPLKREPFGFLTQDVAHATAAVRSNTITAQVMYYYAIRDYQKAADLSRRFLSDPENEKCGKTLLNQYHDTMMRCHLELNEYEEAADYCNKLIESCGHQDTDCWMIMSIISFLTGDVDSGFKAIEMVTAMRNSCPNVWLLYATVLSYQYSLVSEEAAHVFDRLVRQVSVDVSHRFHKRFADVLKIPPQQKSKLCTKMAYFYSICAIYNAYKLACNTYLQQSSKCYTEFSTWDSTYYQVLKDILDSPANSGFQPHMENNYNIIHYENWDDMDMSNIDFVKSFLKYDPYQSTELAISTSNDDP